MIWDTESGQEEWVTMPGGILSFALDPGGLVLACGHRNGIDLYRFDTGEKIKTFPLKQTNITALAFSPNGKHLALGSDNSADAYYSVHFKILEAGTGDARHSLFTPVDCSPFAVCDPDGEHLYTRASRCILKVWDTASGRELSRITGDWRDIRCAGLGPDGKYLAGVLTDSDTIKIWDTLTGRETSAISTGLPNGNDIDFLCFRCGGTKIIVLAAGHGPHIFDAATGRLLSSLPKDTIYWQPNFTSSDDRYFAVINYSNNFETMNHERVTIFDIETAAEIVTFPLTKNNGRTVALYYAPGIVLAALFYKENSDPDHSENKQFVVVNMVSGETLYSDAASHINEEAIAFSPSGESFTISYGSDLHIVPVNAAEGREIIHIPVNHQSSITHVTYLPDKVISVSDDCINIANSKTGKLLRTIEESTDLLLLPASTDGRLFVTASNSIIKTWNIKEKIQETEFPVFSYPEDAACIPEGGKLFSFTYLAASSQIVYCHDTITGKTEYAFPVSGKSSDINRFSFRPGTDQALLYDSFGSREAKLYNFKTGALVLTGEEQKACRACVVYSHDGKFIASGYSDRHNPYPRIKRTILMFDADTGAETKKFPRSRDHIVALAFSHDDKYLVTGSMYHKIDLWDLEKPAVIRTYSEHKDMINMVAFTHDRKRIVSSSDDTSMRIWDGESAACLAILHGIREVIPESVSNPAWRFIVALTVHGTVKLFDKDTLEEAAHIINFKDGG